MGKFSDRYRATFNLQSFFDSKKFLENANYDALTYISNEMLGDINQFVPKKTGRLRQNGTVEDLTKQGFKLAWHRRLLINGEPIDDVAPTLYEGLNPLTKDPVKRWTTTAPDGSPAGDHWIENATDYYKEDWQKKYTKSFTESFRKHIK